MGLFCFQIVPRDSSAMPLARQILDVLLGFGLRGLKQVAVSRLYLVQVAPSQHIEAATLDLVGRELFTDPVIEECRVWPAGRAIPVPDDVTVLEVHLRPGVMDSAGQSALLALRQMGIHAESVRTARRYEFFPRLGEPEVRRLARLLGNDCVEEIIPGGKPIEPAPEPPRYHFALRHVGLRAADDGELVRISAQGHLFLSLEEMRAIQRHFRALGRDPTDLELETLGQTWSEHCVHKTLKSTIVYRGPAMPGGSVETISPEAARSEGTKNDGEGGAEVELRYENLLGDTIARATDELIREGRGPVCLSVFKDNAGIIALDDHYGVAFKVETHNHPSAIEPYGGASTGVGGVIRDVLGCGLGAQPIAGTDVFCVAPPDWPIESVPRGVIHPRLVLRGVVAGVRDYGNRMGIPTVNGAVHFDARYLGNPLVYCGCVGLIPRERIAKSARPGDLIVLLGGRTGRDGIHGATFSSAELTDKHEDEFAHAVQIGNAIEEKKVLDVILQARDFRETSLGGKPTGPDRTASARCLFSAITDCGAGGLSSAVGEMAAQTGAEVDLDKVPLKYAGLRYDEIWISEAQERMVLAVPPENVQALLALASDEDVEATVIGRFTDTQRLVIRFEGQLVGDLDLRFLHEGLPKTLRIAEWSRPGSLCQKESGTAEPAVFESENRVCRGAGPLVRHAPKPEAQSPSLQPSLAEPQADPRRLLEELLRRLSDPVIASKHWIIRQYDHEVGGRSVVKPLAGRHDGPTDAAVIRPRLDSRRGVAIGCGLAPHLSDSDPYWMAVAAIDEALRNVVCVGGDPSQTAILDNFCWPRVDDARNLGALVRACQACYDTAKAYGLPFISGKDSLNNEFALDPADVDRVCSAAGRVGGLREEAAGNLIRDGRIAIPCTLLISAISIVEDVERCVTSSIKQDGSRLYLIGQPMHFGDQHPFFDFRTALRTHHSVAQMIREGLACAVHDVSDGGLLVAVAEMCIASGKGCRVHRLDHGSGMPEEAARSDQFSTGEDEALRFCFDPFPACYIVEVANERYDRFERLAATIPSLLLATIEPDPKSAGAASFRIEHGGESETSPGIPLVELTRVWKTPLDW